jgi:anthranilate synthase/aminodeoxychorismate synthase-like glutamine amidotransferase
MFLIIDNYDSFVYNLADYIHQTGHTTQIVLNDKITISDIQNLNPCGIFISPGPKHPKDIPNVIDIIQTFSSKIPILGICLGHQAIGFAFGAKIGQVKPAHGYASGITHYYNSIIFNNIPKNIMVGRYHSLAITDNHDTIPNSLEITAVTDENLVMAVQHKIYPVYGVQFHPESILTPDGLQMIKNFITICS